MLQQIADYFYETFVAKFDFWLAFGICAQLMFSARVLTQWIASEVSGKSVVPMAYWVFSIAGGLLTLIYGLVRREPIVILGQMFGTFVYVRNIILIWRHRRKFSSINT